MAITRNKDMMNNRVQPVPMRTKNNIGINNNSLPLSLRTSTLIPVSSAPVLLITASKPPNIIIKIPTSIASSKPKIGAIKVSDNLAPTVPLPLTITPSTNSAFGRTCDKIASPKIRINIIE